MEMLLLGVIIGMGLKSLSKNRGNSFKSVTAPKPNIPPPKQTSR